MRRREFIALVASAAGAWPVAARATARSAAPNRRLDSCRLPPPPSAFSLGVGFGSSCATALSFVVGVAACSSLRAFLRWVVMTTSFRDSARLPCLSSEVELALAYRGFCRLDLKDITVGSNWLTQRNSSTFRPYRITGGSLKQEADGSRLRLRACRCRSGCNRGAATRLPGVSSVAASQCCRRRSISPAIATPLPGC